MIVLIYDDYCNTDDNECELEGLWVRSIYILVKAGVLNLVSILFRRIMLN